MSTRDFLDDISDDDDEARAVQRPVMVVPGMAASSAEFDATIPKYSEPSIMIWDDGDGEETVEKYPAAAQPEAPR